MPKKLRKVLVVDDELLILNTVQRALEKVGYVVTTASNRDEFLNALKDNVFAICIVDLNMKDLSLDEIKSNMEAKSGTVRFLVMSGSIYKGSETFLQKPFRINELRKLVAKILER